MQLKEFFFKISFLYAFIPVGFLMKLARKKVIFPFYHFIDDGKNNLVNHLYKPKTKSEFINDLKFFKKHFNTLSIEHLLSPKKNYKNGFLLSFDDGLSNFYSVVVPILLNEKVNAINFVNTDFINNKGLFYRYKVNLVIDAINKNDLTLNQKKELCKILELLKFNKNEIFNTLKDFTIHQSDELNKIANVIEFSYSEFLNNENPYMSSKQIVKLLNKGFSIGAHSKNHPRYSDIDLENQLKQTNESISEIKDKFNLIECSFAFPFSDDNVSSEFFKEMTKKNILTFGSSGLKDEDLDFHFQRIPMEYNSVYSAKTIIKGELVYYILKRFFGLNKIKRN